MAKKSRTDNPEYMLIISLLDSGISKLSEIISIFQKEKGNPNDEEKKNIASEVRNKMLWLYRNGYVHRSTKHLSKGRGLDSIYSINHKQILINIIKDIRGNRIGDKAMELFIQRIDPLIKTFKRFVTLYIRWQKEPTINHLVSEFKKEMALSENCPKEEAHLFFKTSCFIEIKYKMGYDSFILTHHFNPSSSFPNSSP